MRRYRIVLDDGQQITLDMRLWPIGEPVPLKDQLAFEREFGAPFYALVRKFEAADMPLNYTVYFVWRELQRQYRRIAGNDYTAFVDGKLADFEDLTDYPEGIIAPEPQDAPAGEVAANPTAPLRPS